MLCSKVLGRIPCLSWCCSPWPVQESQRHIMFWPHQLRTFSDQPLLSSVEFTVSWWVFLWLAADIRQWKFSALTNICSWIKFTACSNSCPTFPKWSLFSASSLLTKWMCTSGSWSLDWVHKMLDSRNIVLVLRFLFVNYAHVKTRAIKNLFYSIIKVLFKILCWRITCVDENYSSNMYMYVWLSSI
jgi:hypothetical protein